MPDVSDTLPAEAAETTEARGATPGSSTTAEPSASNAGSDVKGMSLAELRETIRNGTLPEPKSKADNTLNDGVVADDSLEDPEATDDLDLNDQTEETEESAPAEETETTETEETTEETEEATESTEEEEPTEESDEPNAGPKRIRVRLDKYDSRDAAVIRLSNEKGISLDAARRELFGEPVTEGKGDTSPANEEGTEETPAPEPVAEIGEIESQIASLKAEKRKAADALELGKVIEIDEKLDEAREKLTQAKAAVSQAEQQKQTEFRRIEQETAERIQRDYPDASKPGTKLFELVNTEFASLKARNSPILKDPEWLELVTIRAASKLPKAEQPKPAAPKPKATPAATKKATPLPAPGPGGVTTPAVPTEDQIRQQIKDARAKGDLPKLRELTRQLTGAKAA